jgi:PemK-like, MazF-like toxin of type II toxin-antitoxin system
MQKLRICAGSVRLGAGTGAGTRDFLEESGTPSMVPRVPSEGSYDATVAALRGLLGLLLPTRRTTRSRRTSAVADAGPARDYRGPARVDYAPHPDGIADPGEVVWTWVPYEDDPAKGKDRPVVVVARAQQDLLVVMLSSKDHAGEAHWLLLGRGAWDAEGRVSSVRLDRVLRVAPAAVRREGATLDRRRFDTLATRLRTLHGWT